MYISKRKVPPRTRDPGTQQLEMRSIEREERQREIREATMRTRFGREANHNQPGRRARQAGTDRGDNLPEQAGQPTNPTGANT